MSKERERQALRCTYLPLALPSAHSQHLCCPCFLTFLPPWSNSFPADRVIEERELQALLRPLGLGIRPIPPDGHCLYRSLGEP